ncbi:MAG: AzlC family ABC transporter permease, partial [Deltaproteobacteria bacterium]
MKSDQLFKKAFLSTVPVMFGYVPIGVAFGFLLSQSGYNWYFAPLMSILIYSGATQFLAINFFINSAPFPEIAVTTLLLNLRHSFFGLSLIKKFADTSLVKPYLIFALTDETYALLTSMEEPEDVSKRRYYFCISVLNHSYWVIGTAIGALLSQVVIIKLKGLNFALTALFVVLTIEQYKKVKTIKPFIIAFAAGFFSLLLVPPGYMLLAAILAGTAILIITRGKQH